MNDGTGYFIPRPEAETKLMRELNLVGDNVALPLMHDLHILFKPTNVRKFLSQQKNLNRFFDGLQYDAPDSPPDDSRVQKVDIDGCKTIPYLSLPCLDQGAGFKYDESSGSSENDGCMISPSGPPIGLFPTGLNAQPITNSPSNTSPYNQTHFLNRFFNPFDPASIYQLWKGHTREIKGGYQEIIKLKDYSLCFQFYGTGVIAINVQNSDHPFDAKGFQDCLNTIDGIFVARTGISFNDLAPLFHVEQVHFNNDVMGDRHYSGMSSRFTMTAQQLGDFLMRVYEKELDGKPHIRQEMCINKQDYDDGNLGSFMGLVMGGVNPLMTNAQIFRINQDQREMVNIVKAQATQIRALTETVSKLVKMAGNPSATGAPPTVSPDAPFPAPNDESKEPDAMRKKHIRLSTVKPSDHHKFFPTALDEYVGDRLCPKCGEVLEYDHQEEGHIFYNCKRCDELFEIRAKVKQRPCP